MNQNQPIGSIVSFTLSHYKIGRFAIKFHKSADTYHLQINFYPLLFLPQDK